MLVPWGEYEAYIGKEDRFFNPQEEDIPEASDAQHPEQHRKRQRARKRYYKSDIFINKRLVDMRDISGELVLLIIRSGN